MNDLRKYFIDSFNHIVKKHPELLETFRNIIMSNYLGQTLSHLKDRGVLINTIYDVGARHGEWSNSIIDFIGSDVKFILIEANRNCEKYLKKLNYQYFIEILSSEDKIVSFYCVDGTGDSYYLERSQVYKDVVPENRLAITFDNLVKKNLLPNPDLIKLDTQGSELDILAGSTKALNYAKLIYMECSLLETNKGGPLIHDCIKFMATHKFVPLDTYEIHRSNGALCQIDILFIAQDLYKQLYPNSIVQYYV